jgi:hypothetical protein
MSDFRGKPSVGAGLSNVENRTLPGETATPGVIAKHIGRLDDNRSARG